MNRMEAKLHILDTDLMQTNCTMNEYQNCIDTYSELRNQSGRQKVSSDLVKRLEISVGLRN